MSNSESRSLVEKLRPLNLSSALPKTPAGTTVESVGVASQAKAILVGANF